LELSKCVDEIQVSIEGVTKQFYEIVRGKTNYDRFIKGLNLIKKYKVSLTLAVTIIPSNINDIEDNLNISRMVLQRYAIELHQYA
jgi:MoaA/NifB/PqqE/SkfB family radical SAM enzyme